MQGMHTDVILDVVIVDSFYVSAVCCLHETSFFKMKMIDTKHCVDAALIIMLTNIQLRLDFFWVCALFVYI